MGSNEDVVYDHIHSRFSGASVLPLAWGTTPLPVVLNCVCCSQYLVLKLKVNEYYTILECHDHRSKYLCPQPVDHRSDISPELLLIGAGMIRIVFKYVFCDCSRNILLVFSRCLIIGRELHCWCWWWTIMRQNMLISSVRHNPFDKHIYVFPILRDIDSWCLFGR